ncbi:hypothetical protein FWH09_00220 [Candidatus Saccharibacteria bacterium]|nr:hypothetical protein [Candidatus Saccharibacteria bacterium]
MPGVRIASISVLRDVDKLWKRVRKMGKNVWESGIIWGKGEGKRCEKLGKQQIDIGRRLI